MAWPLGTLLCYPQGVFSYGIVGLFLASQYHIPVSFIWILLLVFTSVVLTLATPPMSGGLIICLAVLVNQMGIPLEAQALGVPILMLVDFFDTGSKVLLLHQSLVMLAQKGGMLDQTILLKEA